MTNAPDHPPALPIRYQSCIAGALLLAAFVTRSPSFARSVLDWDESLYFLIAAQWQAGHLPYTTIWDNKPLGIYAIFATAQFLFGPQVAAIRIAACLFSAVGAFTVFKIVHKLAGPDNPNTMPAALFAGTAYIVGSLSNDGLAANTELFMATFTALAVLSAQTGGHAAKRGFCAGLALGAAFMVKYVAVFEAPAILFLLLLSRRGPERPAAFAAALAGGALPLALTIVIYWHAGALLAWWRFSIEANFRRLAIIVPPGTIPYIVRLELLRWGSLFAVAVLVLVTAIRRLLNRAAGWLAPTFIVLWLAGGLAGAAAAKSFYDHYFLQMLPALCVASGWLFAQLGLSRPILSLFMALVLAQPAYAAYAALQAALLPVLVWHHGEPVIKSDLPARLAEILNPQLRAVPGAGIYVFDSQPIIYALTGQTPPTAYVLPSVLTGTALAQVAGLNPVAEVARILGRHPAFIICRDPEPTDPGKINPSVYAELHQALQASYVPWHREPGAVIFKLK